MAYSAVSDDSDDLIRIELYLPPKYRSNLKSGKFSMKESWHGESFESDMKREGFDSPLLTLDCKPYYNNPAKFPHPFKFILSILQDNQIYKIQSKEYKWYGAEGSIQRLIFFDKGAESYSSAVYVEGCGYYLKEIIQTCAIHHCAKEVQIFIDRYRNIMQGNMKELFRCLTNDIPENYQCQQKLIILLANLPSPNIPFMDPLCARKLLDVLSRLNRTDPICLSSQQIVRISEYLVTSYHMNNHEKLSVFDTMKYIYPNLVTEEEFSEDINTLRDYGLVPNDIQEDEIEPRYGTLLKYIVSSTPEIKSSVASLLTDIVTFLPQQFLQTVANLLDESVKLSAESIFMNEWKRSFSFLVHDPAHTMRVWKSLIPENKKNLKPVFFDSLCKSMPKAIDADEQLVRDICLDKENLQDEKIARSVVSACAKSPSGVFISVLAEPMASKLFSSDELDSLSKMWFTEALKKSEKELGYKQLRDVYCCLRRVLEMVNSRHVRTEMEEESKGLMIKYGIDKLMNSEELTLDCKDQQKADDNTLFVKHLCLLLQRNHTIRDKISKENLQQWCQFESETFAFCKEIQETLVLMTGISQTDSNEQALLKLVEWKTFWTVVFNRDIRSGPLFENYAYRKVSKSLLELPGRLKRYEYTAKFYDVMDEEQLECLKELLRKHSDMNYDIIVTANEGKRHNEKVRSDLERSKDVLLRIIPHIDDEQMRFANEKLLEEIKDHETLFSSGRNTVDTFLKSILLYGAENGVVTLLMSLDRITQSHIFWNAVEPVSKGYGVHFTIEGEDQFDIGISVLKFLCMATENNYKLAWERLSQVRKTTAEEAEQLTNGCSIDKELEIADQSGIHLEDIKEVVNLTVRGIKEYDSISNMWNQINELLNLLKIDFQQINQRFSSILTKFADTKEEVKRQPMFNFSDDTKVSFETKEFFGEHSQHLCEVLLNGKQVIRFLQRSSSDDLRNLIDAVKDYTDQTVSVSTMSNLLNVDQQLRPVVFYNINDGPFEFLGLLHGMTTSKEYDTFLNGFNDCACQIRLLESLYDNVARRSETTTTKIRNILQHGHVIPYQDNTINLYDFTIRFSISEHDESEVKLSSSDVADLRSKSLLITSTNEENTATKNQFLAFIDHVDKLSAIIDLFNELRLSGYHDQKQFLDKFSFQEINEKLKSFESKHKTWTNTVMKYRKDDEALHFLSFAQIKQVYDFILMKKDRESVKAILDYIEPEERHTKKLRRTVHPIKRSKIVKHDDEYVLSSISEFLNECLSSAYASRRADNKANRLEIWKFPDKSMHMLHAIIQTFHHDSLKLFARDILLCDEDTELDEIAVFTKRRNTSNASVQCICFVEFLSGEIFEALVKEIRSFSKKSQGKRLIIFIRSELEYDLEKVFSDEIFDKKAMTFENVPSILHDKYPNVEVVLSSYPGLGKTEFIKRKAHQSNLNIKRILLTGNISKERVVRDLRNLDLDESDLLHIDIGDVYNVDRVDSIVFQITVLRFISSVTCTISIPVKHICIEVANTFKERVRKRLALTVMFKDKQLEWEEFENFHIPKETASPVQEVCLYLKYLHDLDTRDIDLHTELLDTENCRELLRSKCKIGERPSFYMIHTFLNVLSTQLSKMSSSVFFRMKYLKEMSKETSTGIKSKLFDAIFNMAVDIAQRNVIGYSNDSVSEDILTEQRGRQIHWEDTNHVLVLFNNSDTETVSALFRGLNDVPKEINDLFRNQLGKELEELQDLSQKNLKDRIQKIIRMRGCSSTAELTEYVLTADNILKMTLVSQKIDSNVPIVIMGETGCGKTSLLRYLANMKGIGMKVFSIHAGWNEEEIIGKIDLYNMECMNCLEKTYLLFLDEINTSKHVGLLCDIVVRHRLQGKTLAPNMALAAACNPYRIPPSEINTPGLRLQFDNKEINELSYKVYALPEFILDFVWDFGSLRKDDEKKYIERMVRHSLPEFQVDIDTITTLLATSQDIMREYKQCVSLRDINRSMTLIKWFHKTYLPSKDASTAQSIPVIKAVLLTLCLCYHARLETLRTRKEYREEIAKVLSGNFPSYSKEDKIQDLWTNEQTYLLDKMQIGGGIAKNKALRENVFALFVCVMNRIPICLIGSPGCSKSLSVKLVRSNMRGNDSACHFLKQFSQTYFISYQGSESSTSEGIEKIFETANEYQIESSKLKTETQVVVVIDEIGLAERSQSDPLKVLHAILDPPEGHEPKVSVVGLSNWSMDPAKMNRMLHIACPDMTKDDLYLTATAIFENIAELETICKEEEQFIQNIVENHLKYTSSITPKGFHGIRDFYALVKFLSKKRKQSSMNEDMRKAVIRMGVARNYGGLPKENNGYSAMQTFVSEQCEMPDICDVIRENLEDKHCRNLMLLTETDAAMWTVQNILDEKNMQYEIIIGSRFDGDQGDDYHYRVLSRIIACIEQGRTLILKDLDAIYGSLYDMLNQNYTKIGKSNHCRIALGAHSNPLCYVSETFKCVVLANPEFSKTVTNLPFLGRFEKQIFSLKDIVHVRVRNDVGEIEGILKEMHGTEKYPKEWRDGVHLLPMYSAEVIYTLVASVQDYGHCKDSLKRICYDRLAQALNADGIARIMASSMTPEERCITEEIISTHLNLPIHNGLKAFLEHMTIDVSFMRESEEKTTSNNNKENEVDSKRKSETSNAMKSASDAEETIETYSSDFDSDFAAFSKMNRLITIFTNSGAYQEFEEELANVAYMSVKIRQLTSEKMLNSQLKAFWNEESETCHFLLIECDQKTDMEHLLLVKSKIESYRYHFIQKFIPKRHKPKHVILIVFKERRKTISAFETCNFMTNWEMFSFDSLRDQKTCLCKVYNMKISDLILKHKEDLFDADQLNLAFTLLDYKSSKKRREEDTQRIVRTFLGKCNLLDPLISRVIRFIENEFQNKGWLAEVALDRNLLSKDPTFGGAVELVLREKVRYLLAEVFQIVDDGMMLDEIIRRHLDDDFIDTWSSLTNNPEIIKLSAVVRDSRPKSLSMSAAEVRTKLPYSKYFKQKIDSLFESFEEETVIQKYEENEVEDSIIADDYAERVVFEKALEILKPLKDKWYNNLPSDYLNDFLEYTYSQEMEPTNISGIFLWLLRNEHPLKEDYDRLFENDYQYHGSFDELVSFITIVHIFNWKNHDRIVAAMHLAGLTALSTDEVLKTVSSIAKKHENESENSHCQHLVDFACRRMLDPARFTEDMDKDEWQRVANEILVLASVIAVDSSPQIILRFMHDIMCMVSFTTSSGEKILLNLSRFFDDEYKTISDEETTQFVMDEVMNLKKQNVDGETVFAVICQYARTCYAFDASSFGTVLKQVLEGTFSLMVVEQVLTNLGSVIGLYLSSLKENKGQATVNDFVLFEEDAIIGYILENEQEQINGEREDEESFQESNVILLDLLEQNIFKCDPDDIDIQSTIDEILECKRIVMENDKASVRFLCAVAYLRANCPFIMSSNTLKENYIRHISTIFQQLSTDSNSNGKRFLQFLLHCLSEKFGSFWMIKRIESLPTTISVLQDIKLDYRKKQNSIELMSAATLDCHLYKEYLGHTDVGLADGSVIAVCYLHTNFLMKKCMESFLDDYPKRKVIMDRTMSKTDKNRGKVLKLIAGMSECCLSFMNISPESPPRYVLVTSVITQLMICTFFYYKAPRHLFWRRLIEQAEDLKDSVKNVALKEKQTKDPALKMFVFFLKCATACSVTLGIDVKFHTDTDVVIESNQSKEQVLQTLLSQWTTLADCLNITESELQRLCVISLKKFSTIELQNYLEPDEYINALKDTIRNRYSELDEQFQEFHDVLEFEPIVDERIRDGALLSPCAYPSFNNVLTELLLQEGKDREFPLLTLTLRRMDELSLLRHFRPLLNWHRHLSHMGRFVLRKRECRVMTVKQFLDKYPDTKKAFEEMKECFEELSSPSVWKLLRYVNSGLQEIKPAHPEENISEFLVIDSTSQLYWALQTIVKVQNDFLDDVKEIISTSDCLIMSFLKGKDSSVHIPRTSILTVKDMDILPFEIDEDFLFVLEKRRTERTITYDYRTMEKEFAIDYLHLKKYIDLKEEDMSIEFRDVMAENWIKRLKAVSEKCPQIEELPEDVSKHLKNKLDTTEIEVFITFLGIVIKITSEIENDQNELLREFFMRRKPSFPIKLALNLIPKSAKLEHVTVMYGILEERSGESYIEKAHDELCVPFEGDFSITQDLKEHWNYFWRCLKIYAHRCLSNPETREGESTGTIRKAMTYDTFWPVESTVDEWKEKLSTIISPELRVSQIKEIHRKLKKKLTEKKIKSVASTRVPGKTVGKKGKKVGRI